ncbi:hypothetical protein [Mycobacterium intracellulare]|uniref:hypothetical protein n=1 Tax=Mycobacterium intracellulare TaxID=1767 RepID=UPI001EEF1292|nr:hypothetical protein [Mycobacterium intracellulare]MEE3755381.1 hypothetical protein [Mycobacterium intracellulare]
MSAPTPPAEVIAAVVELRAAFASIHVMHCCDATCPDDCAEYDESESALRQHDEHNFDVRETIHYRAENLVEVMVGWLGADALASAGAEPAR